MYEADYGDFTKVPPGPLIHIIVCEEHLEEHAPELLVKGEAADRINCYFCRGGR